MKLVVGQKVMGNFGLTKPLVVHGTRLLVYFWKEKMNIENEQEKSGCGGRGRLIKMYGG